MSLFRPAKRKRNVRLPWEQRKGWWRRRPSSQWQLVLGLAVLAAGAVALWATSRQRSKVRSTRVAIAEVKKAIRDFRTDFGRCPRSPVELVHPPRTNTRYLEELPEDAWGRPLWIHCPGRHRPHLADVVSAGPSGSFTVDDNVQ